MDAKPRSSRLRRESPYLFTCARCCRCCHAKKIQLNPYEVARLASHVGQTTTAFIRRHTVEGGTYLRFSERNACPFLSPNGCDVHADRPLVCRLYPLGRHVADTGEEWFTEIEKEASCEGARGTQATVMEYLDAQGARPFMRAADLYLRLYWRLSAAALPAENGVNGVHDRACPWTDLDAAVRAFCRETGKPVPDSLEKRMALHIRAIETWAQLPRHGGVS